MANVRERISNFRREKRRGRACWLWREEKKVPPEDKRGRRRNFRGKMFGSWQDRPAFNRFSYLRKPKRSDSDGWNRSPVSEQHTIRFYGPSLIAETSRANRTEWIDIVQPTDMNSLLNLKYWKFIYFVYVNGGNEKKWKRKKEEEEEEERKRRNGGGGGKED